MTRFESILRSIFHSVNDFIEEYIAPLTPEGREKVRLTLEAMSSKPKEKSPHEILVDVLGDIGKQLTDPKTSAATAYTIKAALLFGTIPFTFGQLASIAAQKNLILPAQKAARPNILDKDENIEGFYRKIIDNDVFKDKLAQLGYEDADIATIQKLAEYIPSARDVIQFAVREVFTPETVAAFGQLEGFEDIWKLAAPYVQAAKMSKETFAQFWASHWELPGINQAYEMLHRGFIKPADLDRLLVAADVMPFWRDKLKSISYQVLTRVDVRRMHKLGVLDEVGVLKAYQDIGYDAKNAKLLTDFTIKYNADPESAEETATDRVRKAYKDLTKNEIIAAYSDKLLSQIETATELYYLGYSPDEASQLISLQDYKTAVTDVKQSLKYYHDGFMSGAYNEPDLLSLLGKLSLPATYTDNILRQWKLEQAAKVETPTKAEYLAFYKAGTITETDCRAGLTALGYSKKHIGWYLTPRKAKAV